MCPSLYGKQSIDCFNHMHHHCLPNTCFPTQGRKCLQDPWGGGVDLRDKVVLEGKFCLSASYVKLTVTCLCFMAHVVICPEAPTLMFHCDVFCSDTDLSKHKFFECLLTQVKKQCKPHYAYTRSLDKKSPLTAALSSEEKGAKWLQSTMCSLHTVPAKSSGFLI